MTTKSESAAMLLASKNQRSSTGDHHDVQRMTGKCPPLNSGPSSAKLSSLGRSCHGGASAPCRHGRQRTDHNAWKNSLKPARQSHPLRPLTIGAIPPCQTFDVLQGRLGHSSHAWQLLRRADFHSMEPLIQICHLWAIWRLPTRADAHSALYLVFGVTGLHESGFIEIYSAIGPISRWHRWVLKPPICLRKEEPPSSSQLTQSA